ncbi:MAG: metalloprotease [Marmoricola sp.]|nr:metalloprotease [Marmoricola sp.]
MNARTDRIGARRPVVALAALALTVSSVLLGAPARAGVVAAQPRGCVAGAGARSRGPGAFAHADTPVSTATKHRVAAQLRDVGRSGPAARTAAVVPAVLPSHIYVTVRIHIIRGTHRGDRRVSRTLARYTFRTLQGGYAGAQDPATTPTGIQFSLASITVTRNDSWFHATPGSRAEIAMERRLHRGGGRTLNIYLNGIHDQGAEVLGHARFPWQLARSPRLDGIVINVAALRSGRAVGYNQGDTVIHESGHWLGLLHTFEGGCDGPGDYIADTAPEASPSFKCDKTRDTCPTPVPPDAKPGDPAPAAVPDPVTNFMDYSYDSCMDNFTPDQRTRMVTSFLRYRVGR